MSLNTKAWLGIVYLMEHDPGLLRRRLSAGPTAEEETIQRMLMLIASAGFIASLVVPALDRRLHWSGVPAWVVVVGDALAALCFYVTFLVYKETISRQAYGFRNFENYRQRVQVLCS